MPSPKSTMLIMIATIVVEPRCFDRVREGDKVNCLLGNIGEVYLVRESQRLVIITDERQV